MYIYISNLKQFRIKLIILAKTHSSHSYIKLNVFFKAKSFIRITFKKKNKKK